MFLRKLRAFFNRYESAQPSPLRQRVVGVPADADEELPALSRLAMTDNARDTFANNGFVRDIVAANDIYSVGDGIMPQACSGNAEWDSAAETYFEKWAQRCSPDAGGLTLARATSLVSQRFDVDGEIFAVKTLSPAGTPELRFFETHRCVSETDAEAFAAGWRQGVRFDALGNPTAYRLRMHDGQIREVSASFVIHAFIPETFSSVRGLPQIQHALNSIRDTKEILSLVIARGKLQNAFALKVNSDRTAASGNTGELFGNGGISVPGAGGATGADAAKRSDINTLRSVIPASILNLEAGEDVQSLATNSPGTEILNALSMLDRRSCGGVLPPDFFDPSKIGGASTRMVVSKAARHFERRQTHLIERFLRPVWLFVIGDAIIRGKLPAQDNWTSCEWACPKSITVDAGREAVQDREDVLNGFNSFDDYFAARGKDFRKELPRIIANRKAIRDAEAAAGITDNG